MWACGVFDLGLSESTFFSLTPRHFDALLQRWLAQQERNGALTAMFANAHRDTKQYPHPFKLEDFVPTRRPSAAIVLPDHCSECGLHEYHGHTEDCKRGRQLLENNLAQMRQFSTAFPGTVKNGR